MGNSEAEQFSRVMKRMKEMLPQELVDLIAVWTYEIVFCPGYIHPCATKFKSPVVPPIKVEGREHHGTARPTLLRLNTSVHAKYEQRVLRENTWVMGTGPATTRFLGDLSKARNYIRKIYLKLSIRDHGEHCAVALRKNRISVLNVNKDGNAASGGPAIDTVPGPTGYEPEAMLDWQNRLQEAEKGYQSWLDRAHRDLIRTWKNKIEDMFRHRALAEYTLDFSECFGPAGTSLDMALLLATNIRFEFALEKKVAKNPSRLWKCWKVPSTDNTWYWQMKD
ncbi:MAG: hypothetical protein Q9209_002378 [Squamulea sp. 1 TL-2023]